ncbi:MAG: D-alanyl-D-alanine carboxypeptidase, partial [Pseudomonadota bacterium]
MVLALALAGGPVAAADLAPEHARVPAARPAEVPPPPPATREIARRVGLSGSVGWMVRDLDTGAVLDASSPTARFVPASVAKLPTAAFALDRLGATHRFRTTVLARGRQNGGRLDGDLVLVGGGDPELDSDAMADLAAAVVGAGLAEATGGVIADPGPFPAIPAIEPNQPADAAYKLAIGSDARIVIDGTDFAVPAKVSFVSPEAQFTPKQVETQDEREKLMFRIKVRVPSSLVQK